MGFMILDYHESTKCFTLRVPRSDAAKIDDLMTAQGWDFSTPASDRGTAVLFTKEPYAAVGYIDQATPFARAQLQGISDLVAQSWKAESNAHIKCPMDKELWPFQRAGVEYALPRRHTLVGDQPGCGKTETAICYANEINAKRVLVLCPASIRLQWADRIREWSTMPWPFVIYPIIAGRYGVHPQAAWTIVSYDLARTEPIGRALAQGLYDLIILDECFPVATQVATELGPVAIGDIVGGHLPVRVWSQNAVGELELKKVTRYVRTPAPAAMVRIAHELGVLECTPNHKVYIDGCPTPISAEDLRPGQTLRMVPEFLLCEELLREVLREKLFGQVEPLGFHKAGAHRDDAESKEAYSSAGRGDTHEKVEFRSGISRQTGRPIEVAERKELDWAARGKRLSDRASKENLRSDQLADGACYSNGGGQRPVSELAPMLQGRSRLPEFEDRNRGRRQQPSNETVEISGCPEDSGTRSSRVESVEVYEQTGQHGPWVYNLEVEGNHNYFANGALVGNCHYLKTIDSNRTRAIFGDHTGMCREPIRNDSGKITGYNDLFPALASRCGATMALSGTPLPNRPREIFTLAKHLCYDSIDWMSEVQFNERFNPVAKIDGTRADGSHYTFTKERAGRAGELQARLRANFMVRHLKRDVMPQLKLPVYDIVQVEETKAVKQVLEAESFLEIDPESFDGSDIEILGHVAVVRHQMGLAIAPQVADYAAMCIDGGEEKLVIFAWHKDVCDLLQQRLSRFGVLRIDGSTTPQQRKAKVDAFISDGSVRVMLGNTLALGTGTDGLQRVAAHALLAEPEWVPGNNEQAIDRLDRGGQTRTVQADLFVAPGSILQKILASALRKRQNTHLALDARN